MYPNLELYQLSQQIRELIVQKQLPIGTVFYLLQSLTREIEQLYNQTIENEIKIYNKNQKSIHEAVDQAIQEAPLEFTEINMDNIKIEEDQSGQE